MNPAMMNGPAFATKLGSAEPMSTFNTTTAPVTTNHRTHSVSVGASLSMRSRRAMPRTGYHGRSRMSTLELEAWALESRPPLGLSAVQATTGQDAGGGAVAFLGMPMTLKHIEEERGLHGHGSAAAPEGIEAGAVADANAIR